MQEHQCRVWANTGPPSRQGSSPQGGDPGPHLRRRARRRLCRRTACPLRSLSPSQATCLTARLFGGHEAKRQNSRLELLTQAVFRIGVGRTLIPLGHPLALLDNQIRPLFTRELSEQGRVEAGHCAIAVRQGAICADQVFDGGCLGSYTGC